MKEIFDNQEREEGEIKLQGVGTKQKRSKTRNVRKGHIIFHIIWCQHSALAS